MYTTGHKTSAGKGGMLDIIKGIDSRGDPQRGVSELVGGYISCLNRLSH